MEVEDKRIIYTLSEEMESKMKKPMSGIIMISHDIMISNSVNNHTLEENTLNISNTNPCRF